MSEAIQIAITELEAVEREIGIPSKAVPLLRAILGTAHEPSARRELEDINRLIPDEAKLATEGHMPSAVKWMAERMATPQELLDLLNDAQAFVGKSRCSQGHSVSEVMDRAKAGTCIYCKHQFELYGRLGRSFQRLPEPPKDSEAEKILMFIYNDTCTSLGQEAFRRCYDYYQRASLTKEASNG